ncbi:Flp family type IVb pilin [Helcococcus ovis]
MIGKTSKILALISVVVIAVLTGIGGQLKVKFNEILKKLGGTEVR